MTLNKNMSWRQQIRSAARIGDRAVFNCVNEIRQSTNSSDFAAVVSALRSYAPLQSALLFSTGTPRYEELVWRFPAFVPLSLEAELEWASCWLMGHSAKINRFRRAAVDIQNLLIEGKGEHAISAADALVGWAGWSMWYSELRCALEQLVRIAIHSEDVLALDRKQTGLPP